MKIFKLAALICLMFGCIVDLRSNTAQSSQNSIAQSDQSQEWQRYTVKDLEFSVSLPVHPAMATSELCLTSRCDRRQIERNIGAYLNGVVYTINCVENSTVKTLEEFIGKRLEGIAVTEVSLNGFQGKTYQFTSRGFKGASQIFKTKSHLYQFGALGADIEDPRLKQFFSSIVLGGQRSGTLLEDGIGRVPPPESGDSESVYTRKEVDRTPLIIMQPEPSYTETARQNGITGTVVLKVVFSANGAVTGVTVVADLPMGLKERAIVAARQIKFLPASKDGKFVSMWMQLEYNFNLY